MYEISYKGYSIQVSTEDVQIVDNTVIGDRSIYSLSIAKENSNYCLEILRNEIEEHKKNGRMDYAAVLLKVVKKIDEYVCN